MVRVNAQSYTYEHISKMMKIHIGHESTRMKKLMISYHLKSPTIVKRIIYYLLQANTRAGLHLKKQYQKNLAIRLHSVRSDNETPRGRTAAGTEAGRNYQASIG